MRFRSDGRGQLRGVASPSRRGFEVSVFAAVLTVVLVVALELWEASR
jgi:hypothetical protein